MAVACVAIAPARGARAEPAREAIRIDYSVPEGCPAEGAFAAQMLARTSKVRIASAGQAASRDLDVSIHPSPTGFAGRLELRGSGGHVSHRDVSGATCDEVVGALALITALMLDPLASTEPHAAAAPRPTAPPPPSRPRSRRVVPKRRAPPPSPGWHMAAGFDIALREGATPDAAVTLPVFVELETRGGAALRVTFERSREDAIVASGAVAAFRWTAGALEACPFAVSGAGGALRATPCLRLEAGVLGAQGRRIVPAHSVQRGWAALGALGRIEWSFLPPAFADLGIGVAAPLARDRFFFQPDTSLYRPPALGFETRLGLGVQFP